MRCNAAGQCRQACHERNGGPNEPRADLNEKVFHCEWPTLEVTGTEAQPREPKRTAFGVPLTDLLASRGIAKLTVNEELGATRRDEVADCAAFGRFTE